MSRNRKSRVSLYIFSICYSNCFVQIMVFMLFFGMITHELVGTFGDITIVFKLMYDSDRSYIQVDSGMPLLSVFSNHV